MSIIAHNFNSINIDQLAEDSTIGGKEIPAGYVNATQLCKAGKKLFADWKRQKRSNAYTEALSLDMGIPISRLLIELSGTPDGDASLQGTWVHLDIAISIASWVSPEFEVWANRTLRLIIQGEFKALTPEAELAQKELTDRWKKIRAAGKETRRELTDSIKDWYENNPEGSTCPKHVMYAKTTNAIYQALWGMTALEIESFLGCDRHQLRNHLSEACLKVLERAEDRVVEVIDFDSLKPIDAVFAAQLFPSRVKLG